MKVYNITMQKSVEDELVRLQAKRRKKVLGESGQQEQEEFYNLLTNPSELFRIYLKQGCIGDQQTECQY